MSSPALKGGDSFCKMAWHAAPIYKWETPCAGSPHSAETMGSHHNAPAFALPVTEPAASLAV